MKKFIFLCLPFLCAEKFDETSGLCGILGYLGYRATESLSFGGVFGPSVCQDPNDALDQVAFYDVWYGAYVSYSFNLLLCDQFTGILTTNYFFNNLQDAGLRTSYSQVRLMLLSSLPVSVMPIPFKFGCVFQNSELKKINWHFVIALDLGISNDTMEMGFVGYLHNHVDTHDTAKIDDLAYVINDSGKDLKDKCCKLSRKRMCFGSLKLKSSSAFQLPCDIVCDRGDCINFLKFLCRSKQDLSGFELRLGLDEKNYKSCLEYVRYAWLQCKEVGTVSVHDIIEKVVIVICDDSSVISSLESAQVWIKDHSDKYYWKAWQEKLVVLKSLTGAKNKRAWCRTVNELCNDYIIGLENEANEEDAKKNGASMVVSKYELCKRKVGGFFFKVSSSFKSIKQYIPFIK